MFQLPPMRFPVSQDGIESRGQIRSPWLGTIVDSGIGSSYRPASLCSLSDRYDNPMPESTISLQSGAKNLATILLRLWHWQSDAPTTRLTLINKVIFLTSFSSFLTFHRSYSTQGKEYPSFYPFVWFGYPTPFDLATSLAYPSRTGGVLLFVHDDYYLSSQRRKTAACKFHLIKIKTINSKLKTERHILIIPYPIHSGGIPIVQYRYK